eukprot:UN23527
MNTFLLNRAICLNRVSTRLLLSRLLSLVTLFQLWSKGIFVGEGPSAVINEEPYQSDRFRRTAF